MTSNNCGIYKITNTLTGKFYIGSAVNIKRRLNHHRWQLANNLHHNLHLQNSWNKHGEQAFVFETILLCDAENRLYHEQVFLDTLKPAYNIAICARAPMQGLTVSEETRRKMSEAQKGRTHPPITEETRRKLSEACKGIPKSEEHKRNIGKVHRGTHHTEETRRKMSEAQKRKPPISEETRHKLSIAGSNRHHTEESIQKMRERMLGTRVSEEIRQKISKTVSATLMGNTRCAGHKASEETRRKMSEAQTRRRDAERSTT